jgi:hypothetical protein
MSCGDLSNVTEADVTEKLQSLREAAARSLDACLTAKYIALSNNRVQKLFVSKCGEMNIFNEIICLDRISAPEYKYVLFDFDCKPGTLCFIKPSFLVVVDITLGQVVGEPQDPYIPSMLEQVSGYRPLRERTHLAIGNHTLRDIWIEITGDADPSWGPHQVNNGHDADTNSRAINFGNKAVYHIKIWKNNGGQMGDFIGEFDHDVRYNAAGREDRLELAIVTLDGQTHLRAYSIRKVAEVALIIWLGG